ncbi:hypothetical protein DDZ13_11725 [Coraliomargarita sinensis]|uniref:Uncharacterized protein n=1 Tax=Coraliomargarita sinensis TaxID=2174842 RepID=A0A317ZHW8_9BACT|nr:hypothetical protein [Coraliomargarita sinensis]PXA03359.1 hypothetical protein DDZ13_11725 [Coraliomargarita sinensis]
MKYPFYLTCICLLIGFGLTSATAKESKNAEAEALVEKQSAKEDRLSWLERIFNSKGNQAERETSRNGEEAEDKANDRKAAAKDARGFSDKERAVLEDWQRGEAGWKKSGRKLPPGLQKKVARGGELPPGWKKKLAVGDRLPEEYASEAKSLPGEILKRLPESPEGTEIIRIGDEVIRVIENTREIIDILGISQDTVED